MAVNGHILGPRAVAFDIHNDLIGAYYEGREVKCCCLTELQLIPDDGVCLCKTKP